MRNFLDVDSPLMRGLANIADLVLLNLLWLVCCVPVVTIGPSTAALYTVAGRMARGDWPPVWKYFFRAFRENFKKAFLLSLCLLIPAGLLVTYLLLAMSGGLAGRPLLNGLCWVGVALIAFVCSYAWPLLARYENSLPQTLKNAVILPLANPFLAILVSLLNLLPLLLLLWKERIFWTIWLFWILIGCSLTAYVNTKLLSRFFEKLSPGEKREDPEE